jgi:hypothetical protein
MEEKFIINIHAQVFNRMGPGYRVIIIINLCIESKLWELKFEVTGSGSFPMAGFDISYTVLTVPVSSTLRSTGYTCIEAHDKLWSFVIARPEISEIMKL